MAFILRPNLHPPPTKTTTKPLLLHHHHQQHSNLGLFTHTNLEPPPPVRVAQLNQPTPAAPQAQNNKNKNKEEEQRDEFYVNLGLAVRTLREDLPLLFTKDLNYHIYREDITFLDPLNKFTGIDNYKLIFWALRFHSRILFRQISLDVFRVWQPSENVILIRWNLSGVPRIPWDTTSNGHFQATSRYKLDRRGKIYEHKVDNLAFNFPQQLLKPPPVSVLDLVVATPNPTFSSSSSFPLLIYSPSSSWLELYRSVRDTLDHPQNSLHPQHCLAPCS